MTSGMEKRQHLRISAPAQATLRRGNGETFELPVRDVSLGGAFLFARHAPLEMGEVATLTLTSPGDGPAVTLKAELVRTVLAEDGPDLLGMGFQFVELVDVERGQLEAFLKRLMSGPGGERRAYPRISHQLDVWCRGATEMKGLLRDLSPGGAGLLVDTPVRVGAEMFLELEGDRMVALKVKGIVRSARPAGENTQLHVVGVEFQHDEASREALAQLLGTLLRA